MSAEFVTIKKKREEAEAALTKTRIQRESVEKELKQAKEECTKLNLELEAQKKERGAAEVSWQNVHKAREEAEKEARVAEEIRKKLERTFLHNPDLVSYSSESLPKDAKPMLTEMLSREQKDFSPQKDLKPETRQRGPSRGENNFTINQPRK